MSCSCAIDTNARSERMVVPPYSTILVVLYMGIGMIISSRAIAGSNAVDFSTVNFSRIQRSAVSEYLVFRSPERWVEYWKVRKSTSMLASASPKPEVGFDGSLVPEIDFAKFTLLSASLGTRPHSGYSIVFTNIRDIDGTRTVFTLEIVPGKNCPTLSEITVVPTIFALVPRSNLPIKFVASAAEAICSHTKTINE